MAPESETSDWVHREVLLALRERKPIFPLLLRGRGFSILVDTQYEDVTGERMPPDDFCDQLREVVPLPQTPQPPIPQPQPEQPPQPPPPRPAPPKKKPATLPRQHPFQPEMILIPAGEFLYGDEKEMRELPEFWIDKTPVTNAEYARFVAETGHRVPAHWEAKSPPEDIADHPVVNVSWHDAAAYAEWAGKRLPTEEEWEKAARGTDGQKYPWGDEEPTSDLCNFGGVEGGTTPVGKYSPQGDSPYGCADMAGNVWQWTASDYALGPKVLRGGSWFDVPDGLRSAFRGRDRLDDRSDNYGFRCARGSE
jgi:hypothetical protein